MEGVKCFRLRSDRLAPPCPSIFPYPLTVLQLKLEVTLRLLYVVSEKKVRKQLS